MMFDFLKIFRQVRFMCRIHTEWESPKCNRFAPKIVTQTHELYIHTLHITHEEQYIICCSVYVKQSQFIRHSIIRFFESFFSLFSNKAHNRYCDGMGRITQWSSLWCSLVTSSNVHMKWKPTIAPTFLSVLCCVFIHGHTHTRYIFCLLAIYHQKRCEMCIQAIGFRPEKKRMRIKVKDGEVTTQQAKGRGESVTKKRKRKDIKIYEVNNWSIWV